MKSLCDFTTWDRKNLERVADEMLAKLVKLEQPLPIVLHGVQWGYNGEGRWQGKTRYDDKGTPLWFFIDVEEDGTFTVKNSDPELLAGGIIAPYFESLQKAKDWCNASVE